MSKSPIRSQKSLAGVYVGLFYVIKVWLQIGQLPVITKLTGIQ